MGTERTVSLRVLTVVLAVACGATVANIYYAQPLLAVLGRAFDVGEGTAAAVVTATQLGYATGLLFLLPLGDLLENRRLAVVTLLFTAAALAGAAAAPDFAIFLVLAVLIGFTSVVAQVLVPVAAHFAPEERRGAVVGQVMSGLLLGILLARTVSSLLAAALGWRAVFWLSAALMLVVAVALHQLLPTRTPVPGPRYPALLRSVLALVRDQPELRRRSVAQGAAFSVFSVFWTAIAFHLVQRFHLSQTGIGVFALVGAGGALAAPLAGRVADAGHGRLGRGVALALSLTAMVVAGLSGGHLVVLAVAAVVLDLATQTHQVIGQQAIYALDPDARARINSVYMTTAFLGGAVASAVTGVVYEHFGWTAACLLGAALAGAALTVWAGASVRHRAVRIPPREPAKMPT